MLRLRVYLGREVKVANNLVRSWEDTSGLESFQERQGSREE